MNHAITMDSRNAAYDEELITMSSIPTILNSPRQDKNLLSHSDEKL
jgi:hypothetical protein